VVLVLWFSADERPIRDNHVVVPAEIPTSGSRFIALRIRVPSRNPTTRVSTTADIRCGHPASIVDWSTKPAGPELRNSKPPMHALVAAACR
jgi:hypothetical protein